MKKFTAVLLTVVMVLVMSFSAVVPAMAIESGISYGQSDESSTALMHCWKLLQAQAIVATANMTIESMVRIAQFSPWPDIDALKNVTNRISQRAQEACAAIGVSVKCEIRLYWIAGEWVEIDPLRVVG